MQNKHVQVAPRVVTTGGINSPQTSHIDWLAFTIQLTESNTAHWLVQALREFMPQIIVKSNGKGWFGYKESHDIQHLKSQVNLGLIAHGGENQRGTASVQINAQGCALISDWVGLQTWCTQNAKKITRIDLAHDDFEGRVLSIAKAKDWYAKGLFSQNGSRKGLTAVKPRLIDDLESGDGKTFYIGRRGSGKLLRIYEKGKQLGDRLSTWTRAEVELRDKDRIIPWDALTNPAQYLAAAYPCLGYLSQIQVKIHTISKSSKISLASATHHLKQMGGKTINLLLQQHSGDAYKVVDMLKRDGIPKRLENYAAFLPVALKGDGQ